MQNVLAHRANIHRRSNPHVVLFHKSLAIRIARLKSLTFSRKYFQDVSLDAFSADKGRSIELAVDDGVDAESQLDRQSMVVKLQDLIESSLTEKQRVAIRASLEGMPVEVIASKTGSNRNSVYKLVHDARLKLRKGLEQAGISADDIAAAFA